MRVNVHIVVGNERGDVIGKHVTMTLDPATINIINPSVEDALNFVLDRLSRYTEGMAIEEFSSPVSVRE